jgi:hypothetical protein
VLVQSGDHDAPLRSHCRCLVSTSQERTVLMVTEPASNILWAVDTVRVEARQVREQRMDCWGKCPNASRCQRRA